MKQPANSLLTILSEAGYKIYKSGRKEKIFTCKCKCGNVVEKAQSHISKAMCCSSQCKLNPALNTAFKKIENPKSSTKEYGIWEEMKQRCLNPKNKKYKHYGKRGIKICNSWMKFDNFINDMGERPSDEYSIERIDVNGNYEPSNCVWLKKKYQARNTTQTKLNIEKAREIRKKYIPRIYTIRMLAKEYNVSASTIQDILNNKIWKE